VWIDLVDLVEILIWAALILIGGAIWWYTRSKG